MFVYLSNKLKKPNMKTRFLFPHPFKKMGWVILTSSFALWIALVLYGYNWDHLKALELNVFAFNFDNGKVGFEWSRQNIVNTILGILFIVGFVFTGFSKENIRILE